VGEPARPNDPGSEVHRHVGSLWQSGSGRGQDTKANQDRAILLTSPTRCKELLNRDRTTCKKERFIGGQTTGLTLGVQSAGAQVDWVVYFIGGTIHRRRVSVSENNWVVGLCTL
jgi:hypothetical protein